MRDDLQGEIIEVNKALNDLGHQEIKGSSSKHSSGFQFAHGIRVGNMFWILGKQHACKISISACNMDSFQSPFPVSFQFFSDIENPTYLWYIKKKKWSRGPDLNAKIGHPKIGYCSAVIDRSNVMFISGQTNGIMDGRVTVFNFHLSKWIVYPGLPHFLLNQYKKIECSSTMIFRKDGSKLVKIRYITVVR